VLQGRALITLRAVNYLVGIDIGTSATKAVRCDVSGRVVASALAAYPSSRPRPGWSEQDPRDWWSAAASAVRQVIEGVNPSAVAGVGLSGQMHGLVLLSKRVVASGGHDGEPLRPAILWNDQRTGEQCRRIEEAVGGRARLVELVGNAALPGFTLPKLLWVREHEPDIARKAAALLLPKDYVRFRLTGEIRTDVGDASGLLLLDVDRRAWSRDALRTFDVDSALLPPLAESACVAGRVTEWAAAQTGLAVGTPVVAGSGDNQAGAIGAGVVRPGMVLLTLGTSGVVYAHADRPQKDLADPAAHGRVHTMCAADGDARGSGAWCVTGCMLSAAGSLQWCRDALFPDATFEQLMHEASTIQPGSGGLVFLPYLTGERCPYPDPLARGGWIGLTARHTRGHLVRAVLEGVAFSLCQIVDLFRAMGIDAATARIGGGGGRSPLWRQMLADLLRIPMATTATEDGPAFGAALLAGVGAGIWPSVVSACTGITERERHEPAPPDPYVPVQRVYGRLYSDLRPSFVRLADADH
jgi:xylulokinase